MIEVAHRPCVSIRRHRLVDPTLEDLAESMTEEVGRFLRAAVRARLNIIVSGGTDAGKTTMLRALLAEASPLDRIITIELSYELGLHELTDRHPDCPAWETREANTEGEGAITMDQLVQRANRHNADRVIVGEVLGDEILPMLNAMSQGRSGSMCTIHAESSAGVFRRIASYAVQAPERLPLDATNLLIAGALHFVVHLDSEMYDDLEVPQTPDRLDNHVTAFPARGSRARFVASVREVVDAEGVQVVSNEVYRPGPDRRAVPSAPLRPDTMDELRRFGYEPGRPDHLARYR